MNQYNPDFHHRQSVRLKNYDYAQEGLYFITICVKHHQCVFGNLIKDQMQLNEIGEIARSEWLKTADLRPYVRLHNFIVMPNHFHGILEIICRGVARNAPTDNHNNIIHCKGVARNAPTDNHYNNEIIRPYSHDINIEKNEQMSLISPKSGEMGAIVRAFKSSTTRNIRLAGYDFTWQRNLYEHVIRNYADYSRIDNYIANNPEYWKKDCFFKR